MASRRSNSLQMMSVVKKARRVITIETKLDIIRRSERGFSGAAIARALGLRDSTVRTILKNSPRIKRAYEERMNPQTKVKIIDQKETVTHPLPIISKSVALEIESNLAAWYVKEIRNGNIVDFDEFKSKALAIYKDITKDYSNIGLYSISKEVYEFCKRRNNTVSDTSSEAASADIDDTVATNFCEVINDNNAYDVQTANVFSQTLHEMMEEGGYTPLQVFSVNETNLFWKRLPIKEVNTNLDSIESIDHVTILLGCNVAGDFKLKPLLVNFVENPKALLSYPKDKLPVIWKANKRAVITQPIFCDWFTSYFCPAVEQYCINNNLDHKALLILNDSPIYPTSLDDLSANIKVIFLPSKASSFLQPLDETFMQTFKAHYYYKAISQALMESESSKPHNKSLHELWNLYNIKKAINNIIEAWNAIDQSTMNKIWRQLFPNYVSDFSGFTDDIELIHENISEIAKEFALETSMDYFQDELDFKVDKISSEQLRYLINSKNSENFENDHDAVQIKSLSVTMLGEAFKNLENAMAIISENDPDTERSTKACYMIKSAVSSYQQLYRDKKKTTESSVNSHRRTHSKSTESSECSVALDGQSTHSNEPEPSNIPIDIKLEFSPATSSCSDT